MMHGVWKRNEVHRVSVFVYTVCKEKKNMEEK